MIKIHKYTWTSPDGKTHNQIEHILVDWRRFAAFGDLEMEMEMNSAWKTIRENIKISAEYSLGYFELKKHEPWFDEGCSKLLDQRKEAK
jgi:hypothetical protein